ncbi:MAG TPA: hypothetical protein VHQ65_01395, partial [Thermoanaerobaculia bacterium]|nr:hypothetical protein [Thermoanaerobaculia bacterium]
VSGAVGADRDGVPVRADVQRPEATTARMPPAPMPDSSLDLPARDSRLFALLFIAWCFVAGTLLMYAPWMPVWTRWVSAVDTPWLHRLLVHPTFRGAVSGFGLVHLVWGTHDLDQLLGRYLERRNAQR